MPEDAAPCCGGVPECAICINLLVEPVRLPCGHAYCRRCLASAFKEGRRCPLCRLDIDDPQFDPSLAPVNRQLENYLRRSCTVEYAQRLVDAATEAARTVALRLVNTHDIGFANGRPLHHWTAHVNLATADFGDSALVSPSQHVVREWTLDELVEEVRFVPFPCRVWDSQRGRFVLSQHADLVVRKPPFELKGMSLGLFDLHVIVVWRTWLNLIPIELVHFLTAKGTSEATVHNVDLGPAGSLVAEGLGDAQLLAASLKAESSSDISQDSAKFVQPCRNIDAVHDQAPVVTLRSPAVAHSALPRRRRSMDRASRISALMQSVISRDVRTSRISALMQRVISRDF